MKKICYLCAVLAILWSGTSFGLNGIQLIGVGAVNRGTAGAGVAMPQDSNAIILNPAGMNGVGDRVDLNFTVGFPSTSMDSTVAGGNAAKSKDEGSLLPAATMVKTFMDGKIAAGIGAIFASGFGVDYPTSRLPSALTANAYDNTSRYCLIKIVPAFSYRIIDKLSLGIGMHVNYAFFQGNSSTAAFTQTAGRGRFDPALGIGGSIGVVYDPLDWLSVGATYTSRQYFEKFERYSDLLNASLDLPQQVAVGLAFKPIKGGAIFTDFRWINWGGAGIVGKSPVNGGFGWRDQYVMQTGLQYSFEEHFDVPLTLRTGYNYGRSIISSPVVYANMLVPAVLVHHLTGGLSFNFTKQLGIDLSYTHGFRNTVTDDGTISVGAAGSTLSTKADLFSVQLHLKY